MRTVIYKITTPQLEIFETTSFATAEQIKKEHRGSIMTTALAPVSKPAPQMSAKRLELFKNGVISLHPYKRG